MPGLAVDPAACTGCGACVRVCPSGALQMRENRPVVDAALCRLCGLCIPACRAAALSIVRDAPAAAAATECCGIWVFAEQQGGEPLPVAFELLGRGRALADAKGCKLTAVLLGHGVSDLAAPLIAGGADRVLLGDAPAFRHALELACAEAVCRAVAAHRPEILLFGATAFGRSLAPRVAARLGTGLTADCTELAVDCATGLLLQTRPAFGGNLMATILTEHARPQMATVRPGVMRPLQPDPARTGEVLRLPDTAPDRRVQLLRAAPQPPAASIADAEIIVSAGRGIGSRGNLALVHRLAERLGGAVGVSRPLVDLGWADYRHQVGQTGLSVAPRLLITLGVSGAVQHLAGIGGAQTVVAVNTDPDAPIFSAAHYKVVGDSLEVLTALLAALDRR